MRGRRSRDWPPSRDPHLDAHRGKTIADDKCDEALRALARLLARQAAREMFERELIGADVDDSTPEGVQ